MPPTAASSRAHGRSTYDLLVIEKLAAGKSGEPPMLTDSLLAMPSTLFARDGEAVPEPPVLLTAGAGAAALHSTATFWMSAIARCTRACDSDSGGVLRSRSRSINPYLGMRCVGMIVMSIGVRHLAVAPFVSPS